MLLCESQRDVPEAVIAAGDDQRAVSVEVNLEHTGRVGGQGVRGQNSFMQIINGSTKSPKPRGGSEVRTYSRDGVRVSRQCLQTLSRLNVPDPNALIKLQTHRETETVSFIKIQNLAAAAAALG